MFNKNQQDYYCIEKKLEGKICSLNYMTPSLRKRVDDYKTVGGIFREIKIKEQMIDTLIQKIWALFIEFYNVVLIDFFNLICSETLVIFMIFAIQLIKK